jgi:hypothetical protein
MVLIKAKQAVRDFDTGIVPAALVDDADPALAAWYADPLSPYQARLLDELARRRRQAGLCRGESCFRLELLSLVCHYWLASGAELKYRQLATLPLDDAGRALLELVYGQLLISRKLQAARRHLERGFALAAGQLASADYFVLVRRHEQLGWLALGERAAPPASLQALLTEAAVIAQLAQGQRPLPLRAHHDTVG